MQHIPPWPEPVGYCQAVNSWTVLDLTDVGQGNNAEAQACQANPTVLSNCHALLQPYTYSVWSSDHVFCLERTSELWMLFLFLAGALWLLFTVMRLFSTFDWRGLAGPSPVELLKVVGSQVLLILVAFGSFALLLQIHELNFQLINSLLGGLPNQRVDSLWGKLDNLLAASQTATQNLDPNAWTGGVFGGNLPDNSAPFGFTWGQFYGGLGSLESFLLSTLLPIRFAAMFLTVVTAPLAIMASSLPVLRRYFWTWFWFWLEIEGLATFSALVLACYQTLATPLTASPITQNCTHTCGLAPTEQADILLSFAGIVCAANLAFMWLILGNFLSQITSIYQQQYQRDRQFWGILSQAAVGVGGAIATLISGGTAMPLALTAEGITSGIEELGAVPASPVPGAGMGRTFLSAGAVGAVQRTSGGNTNAGAAAGGNGGGTGGNGNAPAGGGTTVWPVPPGGSVSGPGQGGGGLLPAPGASSSGTAGANGASPSATSGGGYANAAAGSGIGSGSGSASPGGPGPVGSAAAGQAFGSAGSVSSGGPTSPGAGFGMSRQAAAPGSASPVYPNRAVPEGYAGGSGGFTRLDPPWVPRTVGSQGTQTAGGTGTPALPPGYQVASLQAAQALPEVLAQMPLSPRLRDFLFAPWHNGRGEDIDARAVFQSYCYNAVHPDQPLQYQWNGKHYLRVETTDGLLTGVPLEGKHGIEARLQAVPYLRDTLDLHRNRWVHPGELAPIAEALGTLYHGLPRRELYADQVNQIRAELNLPRNAAQYAAHHDQGFQTLLLYIDRLGRAAKGGKP